jgi:transposase
MNMAYSRDYREAAIEFKLKGHTFSELKDVFKITSQTYYNWLELRNETGSLEARRAETRRRKIDPERLKQAVKEKPDAYLRELAELFNCKPQSVFYALKRNKITYKKRRLSILYAARKKERSSLRK